MAELLEQQQITLTSSTSLSSFGSGTRSFYGNIGIPNINTPFFDAIDSKTYSNIVAQSVTITPSKSSSGEKIYTVNYGPKGLNKTSYSYGTPNEVDQENWQGGVNALTIENSGSVGNPPLWVEADDSYVLGTSTAGLSATEGRMSVAIMTGTVTQTFIKSEAQKNTFISSYLSKAGRINQAVTLNFGIGNLLLGPLDGQNRIAEDGDTEWIFTANYHWRIIPGKATNGWQYIWSANTGDWVKPVLSNGTISTRAIYDYADITL